MGEAGPGDRETCIFRGRTGGRGLPHTEFSRWAEVAGDLNYEVVTKALSEVEPEMSQNREQRDRSTWAGRSQPPFSRRTLTIINSESASRRLVDSIRADLEALSALLERYERNAPREELASLVRAQAAVARGIQLSREL